MITIDPVYSVCKFNVKKPKIIWEITNACNYTCNYCVFSSTSELPRGELSFLEILKTLQDISQAGFSYIKFTGGEPFLRPDIIPVLKEAKKLGFDFDISTNASLITEQTALEIAQLSPNFVHVSLDGSCAEEHESVRGKNTFFPTLKGLEFLSKQGVNLRAGCVIHSKNQNSLQNIIELAHEKGAKELVFSLLEPAGRLLETKLPLIDLDSIASQLNKEWPIKVSHNIKKAQTSAPPSKQICPAGSDFLFINSVGDVLPCTWLAQKFLASPQFNLKSKSFLDIINDESYSHLRAKAQENPGICFAENPAQLNGDFSKIYLFATEKLEPLFNFKSSKTQKALTVTGSFDQALVLCLKGFTDIDCVDINPLAKYWAELKRAAILEFDYNQFKSFYFSTARPLDYKQYLKLKQYLSPSACQFWYSVYVKNNYFGLNLKKSDLFVDRFNYNPEAYLENCFYLKNETSYYQLKDNLKTTEFKFQTQDLLSFWKPCEIYDIIYLSNIADYIHKKWPNQDYMQLFQKNVISKFKECLQEKGVLFAAYIYDIHNRNNSDKRSLVNNEFERQSKWKLGPDSQEILFDSALPFCDQDGLIIFHQSELDF